jgi:hypothetical protein
VGLVLLQARGESVILSFPLLEAPVVLDARLSPPAKLVMCGGRPSFSHHGHSSASSFSL